MRIGAPVSGFSDARSWAQLHVAKNLGAAYWPLPVDATPDDEQAYVGAARAANLVIAEVGVWNNVLDPDPDARETNIRYAIARLRQADRVGARCCVNIAGSCSTVWDGPHPDNLSEETFARIVATTRRIIDEAAPTRTRYALEPMPWAPPHDADSMQRLIDAIDRPAFGVHVDMVNMVNAYEKVYHTAELTRTFFDRFGPLICSVHAKDVRLSEQLTLHIDEALPGEGLFDFDTLLTACAALGDIPVMCEHLDSDAAYEKAYTFLQTKARELGITVVTAG